jgi:transposase
MRVVPKTYTPEFRADALALLHRSDRSIPAVAADLGINHWTLRGWYKQEQMAKRSKKATKIPALAGSKDETAEERLARLERENARLRQENDQLRQDREILKKAAAFFAKESE